MSSQVTSKLASRFHLYKVKNTSAKQEYLAHKQKRLMFTEWIFEQHSVFTQTWNSFFLPPRISSTDTGWSTSQTTCKSISEHLRKSLSSNLPLNWGAQILGQAEKSASHLQRFQTWAGKRRDTWEWQNPGWKVPARVREVNNYLIYSNCYFIPKTVRQIVFSSNIGDANLSHPKIYSH